MMSNIYIKSIGGYFWNRYFVIGLVDNWVSTAGSEGSSNLQSY